MSDDKLKELYQSVKIDIKPDSSILQAEERRKKAILEEIRLKLERLINDAMTAISEHKSDGYCILNYNENPSGIATRLRNGGFIVKEESFSPLISHRGRTDRYALIIFWQPFDDLTIQKIVRDLNEKKRREYSKFMSQD
ncbi:MAG: hypothetical protein Solivirus2_70 [Solivirus sp.]|uniref:Uncharacterized protein n=1 Tax=Solivirus sp. TaxID=2487772 RepID=A0A3G5AJV6_9VIRU|nr:MAG: hypothetical protein Solivirus2_70 [Solivirus sp.]